MRYEHKKCTNTDFCFVMCLAASKPRDFWDLCRALYYFFLDFS